MVVLCGVQHEVSNQQMYLIQHGLQPKQKDHKWPGSHEIEQHQRPTNACMAPIGPTDNSLTSLTIVLIFLNDISKCYSIFFSNPEAQCDIKLL